MGRLQNLQKRKKAPSTKEVETVDGVIGDINQSLASRPGAAQTSASVAGQSHEQEPVIDLSHLSIPDDIADPGLGDSTRVPDVDQVDGPEPVKKSKRKRGDEGSSRGKGKMVGGSDSEDSNEMAELMKFADVLEPQWPAGLDLVKADGSTRGLAVPKPDRELLAALYNTGVVRQEQERLMAKSIGELRAMYAASVFSRGLPIVACGLQKAEVFERLKDRYKKKYQAARNELRTLRQEMDVGVLKSEVEGLKVERSKLSESLETSQAQAQSALEELERVKKESEEKLSSWLKQAQAELKDSTGKAFEDGARYGADQAEERLRDKVISTLTKVRNDIGRFAVREFVEGPALTETSLLLGEKDLDLGFKLAVNQLKAQGAIREGFDFATIGSDKPDPFPEAEAGDEEEDPEIDWKVHPHGFAVEMVRSKRDKIPCPVELPQPVDLDHLIPPRRQPRSEVPSSSAAPALQ